MNIIEKTFKNNDNSETIEFTIIGNKEKNSLNIPIWEGSFTITDLEKAQFKNIDILKTYKERNALEVFRQYYQDTFNK